MTAAPHDALFKATFSQVELAAKELRCVLPPALVARMDFGTLALAAGSFVDEELREQHTDLLYSVDLAGQRALAYILFEHQSSGEAWMALRLLRYMLKIWDKCVIDGASRLPVILPVVLHHGASGWRAATCFQDLFELPVEAAEFTPHFRFALDDLAVHSEASVHARAASAFTRLVLSALQQLRGDRELDRLLRGWSGLLRELATGSHGQRGLQLIFQYISRSVGPRSWPPSSPPPGNSARRARRTWRPSPSFYAARVGRRGCRRGCRKGAGRGARRANAAWSCAS